ncbi:SRPBCC domain-containing protein [Bacillus sp. JCM 19034]|uniref:SRPBCC family protein n=1 Tax=Bacillus sp. JCM 19034 TaxID=1481928 RepID=UPI0007802B1D|nr:SRPBCC domain-containing protein [Bacillus sp. JCM 19034]
MANIEQLQTVHAPAAKVYKALTTTEGLSEIWTRELTVYEHVGAVNEFHFGDNDLTKMKIVELTPFKRIEWLCTESDIEWTGTKITFDLNEKGSITNIILRHMNWKEITDFYRFCNYNWAMFLYSLKRYCEEGTGLPYQDRKF